MDEVELITGTGKLLVTLVTYQTLRKGISSSKVPLGGDMLLPRRVFSGKQIAGFLYPRSLQ